MKTTCLYLSLILPSLIIGSPATDSTTAVAVYPIKSEALSTEFALILSDHIESILLGMPRYRVIARSNLDVLISEDHLHESGIIQDTANTINDGTLSAIDKVCTGAVSRVGANFNFTLKMIDVGSGRIDAAMQRSYCGPVDGLLKVADTLIRSICPLPAPRPKEITVWSAQLTDAIAVQARNDSISTPVTSAILRLPSTDQAGPDPKTALLSHDTVPKAIRPSVNNNAKNIAPKMRPPSKLGKQIGIGAATIFGALATLLLISKI